MNSVPNGLFRIAQIACFIFGVGSIIVGAFLTDIHPGDKEAHLGVLLAILGLIIPAYMELLAHRHSNRKLLDQLANVSSAQILPSEVNQDEACAQAIRTLTANCSDFSRARRLFVLRKASEHLRGRYYTAFATTYQKDNELRRMKLLGDVLRYAEDFVYAYNYATPKYLIQFWDESDAFRRYLAIHQEVMSRTAHKLRIQRLFIFPDSLDTIHPYAYSIFIKSIRLLKECGMRDNLYVVNESSFAKLLARRNQAVDTVSFFVADRRFISKERDSKVDNSHPYAIFDGADDEIGPSINYFEDAISMLKPLDKQYFTALSKKVVRKYSEPVDLSPITG